MLYLFGQLALSDSLYYHEDFDKDDYPAEVATGGPIKPEASARSLAAGQQRHREYHLAPADRAVTKKQD